MQRLHAIDVTHLPVDRNGLVSPAGLAAAITPHTALVSIIWPTTKPALAVPRDHALVSLAREREA